MQVWIGWQMSVKKVRNNRKKKKNTHWWTRMVNAGMQMHCVWMDVMRVDENKCKEKDEEKRLTWLDASVWTHWHADANWTWMTVKTKKKKRKKRNTYWSQILVIDGSGCRWWNAQM